MKNLITAVILFAATAVLFWHRTSVGLILGLLCLYVGTLYSSRAFYEVRTWWRER